MNPASKSLWGIARLPVSANAGSVLKISQEPKVIASLEVLGELGRLSFVLRVAINFLLVTGLGEQIWKMPFRS